MSFSDRVLDHKPPTDRSHEQKWALDLPTVASVNKVLRLPYWHWSHDQGREGSCVGHGSAMERAITNTSQNIVLSALGIKTRRYDPIDLWNQAKIVDGWPDTNPGDDNGTSVHAAYDVLRTRGPRRCKSVQLVNGVPTPIGDTEPIFADGCTVNRWATSVDDMRTSLANGLPVTIGISWFQNFDSPEQHSNGEWWIGEGYLGGVRGGHCVCVYGASDRRQAFRVKNSWGREYPLVWLPYSTMTTLFRDGAEATVVTDR